MLRKEFDWYLENQDTLVKQYNGQYLVISGQKIFIAFPSNFPVNGLSSEVPMDRALGGQYLRSTDNVRRQIGHVAPAC